MKKNHAVILLIILLFSSCVFEEEFMENLKNKSILAGIPHNMVKVNSGNFDLGKNLPSGGDVTPVTAMTMTGFSIGKYPVTQEQFYLVMDNFPGSYGNSAGGNSGKLPVVNVSWYDAIVFCNLLSLLEGRTPAYGISGSSNPDDWGVVPSGGDPAWDAVVINPGSNGYRLPTEAQWEYAAKGGNGSPWSYTYAGSNNPDIVAWYNTNSGGVIHENGKKSSNGLGLYDMSGNVREWCWDWHGSYPGGSRSDYAGPLNGTYRVNRGGSFSEPFSDVRSVSRNSSFPHAGSGNQGFRLVHP